MGKYSELLQKELEADEDKLRATIGDLDEDGLVDWCRKEIDNFMNAFAGMNGIINPKAIISRSIGQDDQDAVLNISRKDHVWHDALIEVVKERLEKGKSVPESWRDYLLDHFLGIEKRRDRRGEKTESLRNEAICRCIWFIQKCTKYKASTSKRYDNTCGISIVMQALKDNTGYAGVERVWKERDKTLWPVR